MLVPSAVGRVAGLCLVFAAATSALGAQSSVRGGEIPREAREIIGETMSPYCPGLLLANCPSPAADTLRKAITARVVAGEARESIAADLVATYGDEVRAAPPATGLGLVAWLAPAVALLAAGAWLARWGRSRGTARQGRGTESLPPASAVPLDAMDASERGERLRRLEALVRLDGA